jgi:hypothetical protein
MSIQFDQVEGVAPREAAGPAPAQGAGQAGGQSPSRPPAEQFETNHRRMEWITRRLMAD